MRQKEEMWTFDVGCLAQLFVRIFLIKTEATSLVISISVFPSDLRLN